VPAATTKFYAPDGRLTGRRSAEIEMTSDRRIKQLNKLANEIPVDFHRDDGKERKFYAYAWFHGRDCIYVGEGTGDRWLIFYKNKDYNYPEAHAYIEKYHRELEPFRVVNNVTKTAGLKIESTLIGHFRRRIDGGTLFNRHPGQSPAMPGLDRELICGWQTAAPLTIPPGTKPLSNLGHWKSVKSLPDFPEPATLRRLNDVNPWKFGCPGYHFYEKVLRQNPHAVGETLRLAKEAGIREASTPTNVQGHLKWLFTWRQKGVFLEIDGQIWDGND
jgi:hypothetical protein